MFRSEKPKSPWKMPLTQRQYCSGYEPVEAELLARAAAFCSGVADVSPPSRMSMMSPGSSRTMRKMMIEIPISVGIVNRTRLRT